jgi:hypothetical protein
MSRRRSVRKAPSIGCETSARIMSQNCEEEPQSLDGKTLRYPPDVRAALAGNGKAAPLLWSSITLVTQHAKCLVPVITYSLS